MGSFTRSRHYHPFLYVVSDDFALKSERRRSRRCRLYHPGELLIVAVR